MQAQAKAQLCAVKDSAAEMAIAGEVRDSGISHSSSAAGFAARRHAAVPNTGWNWNRSRRAANRDLMTRRVPPRLSDLKHTGGFKGRSRANGVPAYVVEPIHFRCGIGVGGDY